MALVAAAAAPQARKLRVGVFADAPLQPRWVIDAFARLAGGDFARIAALAITGRGSRALPWPVAAYARLDAAAFGADPSTALEPIERIPHERLLAGPWPPDLRMLQLDVAFVIGEVDETIFEGVARYGVWRFAFGADQAAPAALAGFSELSGGEPLTASRLIVSLPGQPPRLAYQSWSRTYAYSLARNRAQLFPKTAEFPYRALRELHRHGTAWLDQCRPIRSPAVPYERLNSATLLRELSAIGTRVLKRAWTRALNIEQWSLAFRFGDTEDLPGDLAGFTHVAPPKDRDWADPFILEAGGRHYVFFEELPYAAGKAHISMIEVRADGSWSTPVRVLERDYHLSYPFLLQHEGAVYMIPESAENRSVELYRCIDFPRRWRLERVLLQGLRCVDATLYRAHDRWWMFANVAAGTSPSFDDELHLFHAKALDGEWQPHAQNPVRSDVRSARPGGALYRRNGALYRPAQICVPRYGAGLCVHRIQRLTPHDYAERPVQRVLPGETSGILGLHTMNRAGAVTVVDAFTRRSRL